MVCHQSSLLRPFPPSVLNLGVQVGLKNHGVRRSRNLRDHPHEDELEQ